MKINFHNVKEAFNGYHNQNVVAHGYRILIYESMKMTEDIPRVVRVTQDPLARRRSHYDKRHVEQSHNEVTNSQEEQENDGSFLEVLSMAEGVHDNKEVSRQSKQEVEKNDEGYHWTFQL